MPSPEVIAVGNDIAPEPYMITPRVTGTEASHHPKRDRIIHSMGRYAAMINSIQTQGFGSSTGPLKKQELTVGRATLLMNSNSRSDCNCFQPIAFFLTLRSSNSHK